MATTLAYLRGRRTWVIPNFVVWGDFSIYNFLLFYTEMGQASNRVMFDSVNLGGLDQTVNFSDLRDLKGNQLPVTISQPKVVVLSKNGIFCFVVGPESDSGFKIARQAGAPEIGLVDLMIMEMG
jgi:hypothetical protein